MNSYNQITTFNLTTLELTASLRILQDEQGALWFIAKDICEAVGMTDVSNIRKILDEDEIKAVKLTGFVGRSPLLVSESGLYALIMRSNKPSAKPFRKWVTSEVLPSIRKHGAYVKGAEQLSPEGQIEFYRIVQSQLTHALKRHDRLTQHDHWRTPAQQKARSQMAAIEVAGQMGLPLTLVETCAASGIDRTLQSIALQRP